jgi:hypothetical protein
MSTLRSIAAGLLLAAILPASHAAQPAEPAAPAFTYRIEQILADTQKTSPNSKRVDLVWWMPAEFWIAASAGRDNVSEADKAEIVRLFRDNTVVGAIVGDLGTFGVDKFRSESELREQMRLVDPSGNVYAPIASNKVDKRLTLMLQMMRPMLANVAGEMGTNLNFFVFPAKAKDGKLVADPRADGKLVVKIAETEYKFRLPLGSLMPPRVDNATGEEFPGTYHFNPYTGAPLQSAGASQ